MMQNFGSFHGSVAAGENVLETIAQQQRQNTPKWQRAAKFSIQHLAVVAPAGTSFKLNGHTVILPASGVFEVGNISFGSLVFDTSVNVCIPYLY